MQLEEKGLLKTEDTIDNYISDFPRGDEITIHQLLSHTSGLPLHPGKFDITNYKPSNVDPHISIDTTKLRFTFNSGKYFNYSNVGYILLGYIIESITNTELDVYFKEKNYTIQNLAVGYSNFDFEKAPVAYYDEVVSTVRGSGGLCSTVKDLYTWNNALFSGKIISLGSLKKAHTPYMKKYGYGWQVNGKDDEIKLYHMGNAESYEIYMAVKPSENTFIIFISNVLGSDRGMIKYDLTTLLF